MTFTTGDLGHTTKVSGATNQWDAGVGDKSTNTDTSEIGTDTGASTGLFSLGVTIKPATVVSSCQSGYTLLAMVPVCQLNSAQPPVINSALTASGTVGVSFSYTITATNSPTSFNATGLPGGLSVNTSTGVISGTPTTAATTNVAMSATNSNGTVTATLVVTIGSSLAPGFYVATKPVATRTPAR